MPTYKSKKRRANGDGSYSVLQNLGKIRYQAFAMDEQENLLYFRQQMTQANVSGKRYPEAALRNW